MQHAMRENTEFSKNEHKRAHASLHKRVLIEKERHNMPSVLIIYKKINLRLGTESLYDYYLKF